MNTHKTQSSLLHPLFSLAGLVVGLGLALFLNYGLLNRIESYGWILRPLVRILESILNERAILQSEGYALPSALVTIQCAGMHFMGMLWILSGLFAPALFFRIRTWVQGRLSFRGRPRQGPSWRCNLLGRLLAASLLLGGLCVGVYALTLLATTSRILIQIQLGGLADASRIFRILYNLTGAFVYLLGLFGYASLLAHLSRTDRMTED